jgi:hypothetical protein
LLLKNVPKETQECNSVQKDGEFLGALTSAILTVMYGDVPWTELLPRRRIRNIESKIDKQKDLYTNILALLDQNYRTSGSRFVMLQARLVPMIYYITEMPRNV